MCNVLLRPKRQSELRKRISSESSTSEPSKKLPLSLYVDDTLCMQTKKTYVTNQTQLICKLFEIS